jgi:hypothetical protein
MRPSALKVSRKKIYIAVLFSYIEGMSTAESRIVGCFLPREAVMFQQVTSGTVTGLKAICG